MVNEVPSGSRFRQPITDAELQVARMQAIPKNTVRNTTWSMNVDTVPSLSTTLYINNVLTFPFTHSIVVYHYSFMPSIVVYHYSLKLFCVNFYVPVQQH